MSEEKQFARENVKSAAIFGFEGCKVGRTQQQMLSDFEGLMKAFGCEKE